MSGDVRGCLGMFGDVRGCSGMSGDVGPLDTEKPTVQYAERYVTSVYVLRHRRVHVHAAAEGLACSKQQDHRGFLRRIVLEHGLPFWQNVPHKRRLPVPSRVQVGDVRKADEFGVVAVSQLPRLQAGTKLHKRKLYRQHQQQRQQQQRVHVPLRRHLAVLEHRMRHRQRVPRFFRLQAVAVLHEQRLFRLWFFHQAVPLPPQAVPISPISPEAVPIPLSMAVADPRTALLEDRRLRSRLSLPRLGRLPERHALRQQRRMLVQETMMGDFTGPDGSIDRTKRISAQLPSVHASLGWFRGLVHVHMPSLSLSSSHHHQIEM